MRGSLFSSHITNGLTEVNVKTCYQSTIHQYKHLSGIYPNNPEAKVCFNELTGAEYLIKGHYFQQDDVITIESQLVNAKNGVPVRNFPIVQGLVDNKEELADQLTCRHMSYWVAKDVIDRGKFKTPIYA